MDINRAEVSQGHTPSGSLSPGSGLRSNTHDRLSSGASSSAPAMGLVSQGVASLSRPLAQSSRSALTVDLDGMSQSQMDSRLRRAVMAGKEDEVRALLADGRPDPSAYRSNTAFQAACKGRVAILAMLLADDRVDPCAAGGSTLRAAVDSDHAAAVKELLTHPSMEGFLQQSDVIADAASEGSVRSLKLLLQDGRADPMVNSGEPLQLAAENCRLDALLTLLKDPRVKPEAIATKLVNTAVDQAVSFNVAVLGILAKDDRVLPHGINPDNKARLMEAVGRVQGVKALVKAEHAKSLGRIHSLTKALPGLPSEVLAQVVDFAGFGRGLLFPKIEGDARKARVEQLLATIQAKKTPAQS